MNHDYDLKRYELFRQGIGLLFSSYNRTLTKELWNTKIDMLMDSLSNLKDDKILEFFKSIPLEFSLLPSDAQLIAKLRGFKQGGITSTTENKYDLRYGYFDKNGYYIPNGTKIDFMRADDDQLNERQKRFRNAFNDKKLPSDYLKEFTTMREIEFDYPRGIVQKHRNNWGLKDYEQSGIDAPDYVTF